MEIDLWDRSEASAFQGMTKLNEFLPFRYALLPRHGCPHRQPFTFALGPNCPEPQTPRADSGLSPLKNTPPLMAFHYIEPF